MPPSESDLLITGCSQLLTLRGPVPRRGRALAELDIVPDGALLIRDGRIAAIGTRRQVERLPKARRAKKLDLGGRVVLPGFVDSHTHLDLPREPRRRVRTAHRRSHLRADRAKGRRNPLDRSCPAPRIAEASERARAAISPRVCRPRHYHARSQERLRPRLEKRTQDSECSHRSATGAASRHPANISRSARSPAGIPQAPERLDRSACKPADSRGRTCGPCRILRCLLRRRGLHRGASPQGARRPAAHRGLVPRIHAEQLANTGAARLAVESGAASADHLEKINAADIRALARSNVVCTLLPGCCFHLGLAHYAPARKLIDAGAIVALATDFNPGTSPTVSMPMILSLACTQMRMTPAEAIAAATINPAYSLACTTASARSMLASMLISRPLTWPTTAKFRIISV